MKALRRTGLVWHELLMWHDTSPLAGFLKSGRGVIEPDGPSESPASKRRVKNLLDVAGVTEHLVWVKPRRRATRPARNSCPSVAISPHTPNLQE